MSRITREGFIDQFKAQGGLDTTKVGADAQAVLARNGIGAGELAALGGTNGKVDTRGELGRLFDLIDRVDHDGHYKSIETKTGSLPTPSGELYETLKAALQTERSGVRPKTPGTDPTAPPSAGACQTSLAAIADAGFTDVRLTPTPYFNQGQPRWANHDYPRSPPVDGEMRTLKDAGCAPCALAMIDCALRNAHASPFTTADYAVAKGFSGSTRAPGSDTGGLAKSWATAHGLGFTAATSADQAQNVDTLKAGLRANGLALVSVGPDPSTGRGHFTNGGHVVVVNGSAMKNGEEWFSVVNPGRANQAAGKALLGVDADVAQVTGAANGIGSVWISRTQLQAEMRRCYVLSPGVTS